MTAGKVAQPVQVRAAITMAWIIGFMKTINFIVSRPVYCTEEKYNLYFQPE
jgi:hypothetical protein